MANLPCCAAVALSLLVMIGSCVPLITGDSGALAAGSDILFEGEPIREAEPDNEFLEAQKIANAGIFQVHGDLADAADRDVFAAGPAQTGDQIALQIDGKCAGGMAFCLFDAEQRLLVRKVKFDGDAPVVARLDLEQETDELYLVGFPMGADGACGYSATLSRSYVGQVASSLPQIILLKFDGGSDVVVGDHSFAELPVFDAQGVDPSLAGQTASIVESIAQYVRQDFAGLNVLIRISGDGELPAGPYSIVYFGGNTPDLLGTAASVDDENANLADVAIVYTEAFRLFMAFRPNAVEVGQVLANVASHEIGHLLGLRHTRDADDLMDITASAWRMMGDQWFKLAPLHATVCPIGSQDGPASLSWAVGGQLPKQPAANTARTRPPGSLDFQVPRDMLATHGRSTRPRE